MCGITGIVDLRAERRIDEALLRTMNDSLDHRGPDGSGFHFEPGVGLGHRRLSIIDLEGGRQPLYNEDGSVVVTFNGEIFNFAEIERELVARGHTFRTRCDTEVIVHAWEEWREKCLDRFNGMFAFAIWDQRTKTLFLARDRLGVKPVYYAYVDGLLIFGSELKALMANPSVPRRLDSTAVEEYFTFGYVPDPKTIYRDVHKLEPGCYLVLNRGAQSVSQVRYWDVPLYGERVRDGGPAEWQAELVERLREAVRKRLVADVPLGAFLSGGIDSSAVVAMMRDLDPNGHILTCSIGFHEPRYDESEYADLVAKAKRTDHRVETVTVSDYGLLDKLVDVYDEPYADSSAIPTYRVCELARRHVTVALSGDGGDENFIGYRRYRLLAGEEAVRGRLPLSLRRSVFGPLGRWYPKLDWAPRVLRAKSTFQALARDRLGGYLHAVSLCTDDLRVKLFSSDFRRDLHGYHAGEVFERHVAGKSFNDAMAVAQYLDFKTYLPGDILTKVDRASMAHSLEVRTPFLDYEFVEWAAGLPSSVKLRGGTGKHILKEALRPSLPPEVLDRRKMGFAVPVDMWFRGALSERIREAVNGPRLAASGLFDTRMLARLADEHQSGRRDHTAALWSLLMFDGFLRNHERAAPPREQWQAEPVAAAGARAERGP